MMRSGHVMIIVCMLTACGGNKGHQWDNIDYTPVYKAYEARENDSRYTQPNITACVDDDLYNCK